ncbi:hypothetical protein LBMAG56_17370 [Verrucomicrobiota bacterium]|nr:hypothetical protein LBMAG56_17370 [Verrucomicrobiota bacterium]
MKQLRGGTIHRCNTHTGKTGNCGKTASFSLWAFIACCLLLLFGGSRELAAQTVLPPGFTETQIYGLFSPSAMVQAPDGRIFVCEQGGYVKLIKNDAVLATPFLSVDAQAYQERGLVGITLDPDFVTNQFVYIYYTAKTPTFHNRLSRFTANGDVVVPGSEVILLDLPTLGESGWHNGGALNFGPDGKLYLAVGENNIPANSQSLQTPLGKILRLNADGTIPTDNPFYNSTSGINKAIWAMGLRNPFTATFQPGTGRLFINDVGEGAFEEINDGSRGANYGWPTYQGYSTDNRFQSPFYSYEHPFNPPGSSAITGGAFYNPPTNQFPAAYLGKYFFMDGFIGTIRTLNPVTGEVADFASNLRPVGVYLITSQDGSLYYGAHAGQSVYKIQYTGILAPQIGTHPGNNYVSIGQSATYQIAAYGSAPLSYQWERQAPGASGFTPIAGATQPVYTLAEAAVVDSGTQFRCVVQNTAGSATSRAGTLTVTSDRPPVGTIVQPSPGTTFRAGDTFDFSGTATDAEVGNLSATAFKWRVDFQHHDHAHPFITDIVGVTNGTFTIPTVGESSDDVWYRVYLTVTDPTGLSHTTYRDILPIKSTITLVTDPPGLRLALDGEPVTAPFTFVGVAGVTRTLSVDAQVSGSTVYEFISWSDGGTATHNISTPATNQTYTAMLRAAVSQRDSAVFVSQSFLTLMTAGQRYPVQVTLRNNGSTIWSTNDGYYLGSAGPEDNLMWGMNRVSLPGPVAPGETVTLNFTATAPYPGGVHNIQWRMVHEGSGYFGEATTSVPILVAEKGNAAIVLDQQVPASIAAGQRFNATITFKNVGTNTWTPDARYRLASQNPDDNSYWGFTRVLITNTVLPGDTVVVTIPATAPTTPGSYDFQWRPLQEGVEFFGEKSTNVAVTVLAPLLDAAFVSQSVPSILVPGQRYNASITLRNTGSGAWTGVNKIRLSSQNPLDNKTWGTARAVATGDVAPGELAVFKFVIIAPTNSGDYNFQWRMIQEGVARFGELTPNLVLRVAPAGRAVFVSQTVPATLAPGQSADVQVALRNVGTNTWRAGGLFHLVPVSPDVPGAWGVSNVPLFRSVAPGELALFRFKITAPATVGTFPFRWRLQQDGLAPFGEPTPLRSVRVVAVPDNAQFVTQSVPTTLGAGEQAPVAIRLRNLGSTTWTTAAGHALASLNPTNATTWGTNRIALPGAVPPGQEIDIPFTITAPVVPGVYPFQWQMLGAGNVRFGQPTTPRFITVLSGGDSAAFIAMTVTNQMITGQTYTASITLRNTGTNTWSHEGDYHLGPQSPQDNPAWGLLRTTLAAPVAPGQTATMTFTVTAPRVVGTNLFQWRMVHDGVGWFGEPTPAVPVAVLAAAPAARDDAAFATAIPAAPTNVVAGADFFASITVTNRGNTTWSTADGYRLAAQNPATNATWGGSFVNLPATVPPGGVMTFFFRATAPIQPGLYNFQWQMRQDASGFFGDLGPSTLITVAAPRTNGAAFLLQNVPPVLTAGTTVPVSLTFRNTGTTTWTPASGYQLAAVNPDNNRTWSDTPIPSVETVAPGEVAVFNFNIDAPTNTGDYNFQWRLRQTGAGYFGEPSENLLLSVVPSAPPQTNHAAFVAVTVPDIMAFGETNFVTVRMRNAGTTTWTPQAGYNLAAQNPTNNTTWGGNRASLAGVVAPGETADFNFTVVAPTNAGAYNFQWQMNLEGAGRFGELSSNVVVQISGPPVDDSAFVSQTITNRMAPGGTYDAQIILRNTGNTTWPAASIDPNADAFNLGSQNPDDNTTWGFPRVELANAVAPGQNAVINFTVTAPTNAGTYDFQWRMVHEGVAWFGAFTSNLVIQVGTVLPPPPTNDAAFVSQIVPATLLTGRTNSVTVVLRNTGTTTWTSADGFALAAQNPLNNTVWGTNRIALAGPVAPGANATFTFNVVAPSVAGTKNFRWRMVQGAAGYFGDLSPNVPIVVTAPATNTNNAQFVSQTVLSPVKKGSNFFVTLKFKNTGTTTWRPETSHRLGSRNPTDNTTWGFARVQLGTAIAPGATATFFFQVKAPATAGTYNMQWQMLQDGVDWFGDRSTNVAVTVTN